MELIRQMEEDSIGRNMIASRQLLEIVYERQEKRRVALRKDRAVRVREGGGTDSGGGGSTGGESEGWSIDPRTGEEDVDWVDIIAELGLQVVNCRL